MIFEKFFKMVADLTSGKEMSKEDDREFVNMMLKLSEQQPPNMSLIDYAKKK